MKQLIILAASVLLGVFLFHLIAGDSEKSMYSQVKNVWQMEMDARTRTDDL